MRRSFECSFEMPDVSTTFWACYAIKEGSMNHTRDVRPFYLYIVRYAYEENETGFNSRWKGMLVFGFLFLRLRLKASS